MKINKNLLRVAGAVAITLLLASGAFIGINRLAFAAVTQPETPSATEDIQPTDERDNPDDNSNTNPDDRIDTDETIGTAQNADPDQSPAEKIPEYQEPELTVMTFQRPDRDGEGTSIPDANAMSMEEAALIGAQYIYDMYGENIDGKSVVINYSAFPSQSRAHWIGNIADHEDALEYAAYNKDPAKYFDDENYVYDAVVNYYFSIDAVTGERISITKYDYSTDWGTGKPFPMTMNELNTLQYEAPDDVETYAELARAFAEKHFSHSQVASVEFTNISINLGSNELEQLNAAREAVQSDMDMPYDFTVYEKGRKISFNVTDDTGRVARMTIDIDSKQLSYLDTSDSDFIPGYSYDDGGTGLG